MALANLVIKLHQRLLAALEQDNRQELRILMVSFGELRELWADDRGKLFIVLMEDLEYSAQHGVMGVKPKALAAVPSLEAIMTACA